MLCTLGITLGVSLCVESRASMSVHLQSTPFHQMKSGRRLETGLTSLRTKFRYSWHPIWHACSDLSISMVSILLHVDLLHS